jgi:hypothetical protein
MTDDERNTDALNTIAATLRGLDNADNMRAVLLAAGELFSLGLSAAEGHDGEPACLSVGDVERILKAARGAP